MYGYNLKNENLECYVLDWNSINSDKWGQRKTGKIPDGPGLCLRKLISFEKKFFYYLIIFQINCKLYLNVIKDNYILTLQSYELVL